MYNLTGIYWIKNEARYLPEYLEFHLLQGFDHFIFYDNGSTDKTAEILAPYVADGLVELRTYPEHVKERKNFWVMAYCIVEQRQKSRWIHFHAVDERLVSPLNQTIPEILVEFEEGNIAGVSVSWRQFHSNGLLKRKEGLLIENFTVGQTEDPSHHVKTIIRPELVDPSPINTPHNFSAILGYIMVDENHLKTGGPYSPNKYTFEKLANYHYATMSKEEYDEKMNKGVLDIPGGADIRRENSNQWWYTYHCEGDTQYNDLLPWVNPVRKAIASRFKDLPHLLAYINH